MRNRKQHKTSGCPRGPHSDYFCPPTPTQPLHPTHLPTRALPYSSSNPDEVRATQPLSAGIPTPASLSLSLLLPQPQPSPIPKVSRLCPISHSTQLANPPPRDPAPGGGVLLRQDRHAHVGPPAAGGAGGRPGAGAGGRGSSRRGRRGGRYQGEARHLQVSSVWLGDIHIAQGPGQHLRCGTRLPIGSHADGTGIKLCGMLPTGSAADLTIAPYMSPGRRMTSPSRTRTRWPTPRWSRTPSEEREGGNRRTKP